MASTDGCQLLKTTLSRRRLFGFATLATFDSSLIPEQDTDIIAPGLDKRCSISHSFSMAFLTLQGSDYRRQARRSTAIAAGHGRARLRGVEMMNLAAGSLTSRATAANAATVVAADND